MYCGKRNADQIGGKTNQSLDQGSQERVQSPSLDILKIQFKRPCTTSAVILFISQTHELLEG